MTTPPERLCPSCGHGRLVLLPRDSPTTMANKVALEAVIPLAVPFLVVEPHARHQCAACGWTAVSGQDNKPKVE